MIRAHEADALRWELVDWYGPRWNGPGREYWVSRWYRGSCTHPHGGVGWMVPRAAEVFYIESGQIERVGKAIASACTEQPELRYGYQQEPNGLFRVQGLPAAFGLAISAEPFAVVRREGKSTYVSALAWGVQHDSKEMAPEDPPGIAVAFLIDAENFGGRKPGRPRLIEPWDAFRWRMGESFIDGEKTETLSAVAAGTFRWLMAEGKRTPAVVTGVPTQEGSSYDG